MNGMSYHAKMILQGYNAQVEHRRRRIEATKAFAKRLAWYSLAFALLYGFWLWK